MLHVWKICQQVYQESSKFTIDSFGTHGTFGVHASCVSYNNVYIYIWLCMLYMNTTPKAEKLGCSASFSAICSWVHCAENRKTSAVWFTTVCGSTMLTKRNPLHSTVSAACARPLEPIKFVTGKTICTVRGQQYHVLLLLYFGRETHLAVQSSLTLFDLFGNVAILVALDWIEICTGWTWLEPGQTVG